MKNINTVIWRTWWIGTILVTLSWTKTVSYEIGWLGFGLACSASLISVVVNKYWKYPEGFDITTHCSFCAREVSQLPQTIKSPNGILICKDCIEVCNGLLEDNPKEKNQEVPSEQATEP